MPTYQAFLREKKSQTQIMRQYECASGAQLRAAIDHEQYDLVEYFVVPPPRRFVPTAAASVPLAAWRLAAGCGAGLAILVWLNTLAKGGWPLILSSYLAAAMIALTMLVWMIGKK